MAELNYFEWESFLARFPNVHILQSAAWGELKAASGWEVHRLQAGDSGAQILFRQMAYGIKFAYIPKGPVGKDWDDLLPEADHLCRKLGARFLKVEPDAWEEDVEGASTLNPPVGFRKSGHAIQPARTLVLDLSGSEGDILGKMKQKTRYNIRLAMKKGVIVKPSADLDAFYHLMEVTSQRDRFGVHQPGYYRQTYELFHPKGQCELLIAEFDGEPVAALMVLALGQARVVFLWSIFGRTP